MEGFLRCFTGEWDRITLRPPYKFIESGAERISIEQHHFEAAEQSAMTSYYCGIRWARLELAREGQTILKCSDPLVPLPEEIRTDAVLLCCSAFLRGKQFAVWCLEQAERCILPSDVAHESPQWVEHNRSRYFLEVRVGRSVRLLVFAPLRTAQGSGDGYRVMLLRDTTFSVVEKRGAYCRPRGKHRDRQYIRSLGQGERMWPTVRRHNRRPPLIAQLPPAIQDQALRRARAFTDGS